jgi:pyridoxine 4-dehydrogenase
MSESWSSTSKKAVEVGKGTGIWLPAPLAIGTLQWGTTWVDEKIIPGGRIDDETAEEVLRTLLKSGKIGLLDTAEGYGGGTSEQRIAFLRDRLEATGVNTGNVMVASKFLPTFWRWTQASFERALRGSLDRLNMKSCSVYYLHSPVHPLPINFWIQAAATCKKKGLVKTLGLSNCDGDQVRAAVEAGRRYGIDVSCNQIMFNLLDYKSPRLQKTLNVCRELGVTVIAYSPIAQGLLTDKLTRETFATNRPAKMTGITWDRLDALRSELRAVACARGKTMAQVAINWCVCHGTVPLVGCRSVKQAEDTLGSLGWHLTAEEVERLDNASLARSTLDGPIWRRGIFVSLAALLIAVYRACIALNDWFGTGTVRMPRMVRE